MKHPNIFRLGIQSFIVMTSLSMMVLNAAAASGTTQAVRNLPFFADCGLKPDDAFEVPFCLPDTPPMDPNGMDHLMKVCKYFLSRAIQPAFAPSQEYVAGHIQLFPSDTNRPADVACLDVPARNHNLFTCQTGGPGGRLVVFIADTRIKVSPSDKQSAIDAVNCAIEAYLTIPSLKMAEAEVTKNGSAFLVRSVKDGTGATNALIGMEAIVADGQAAISIAKFELLQSRPGAYAPDENEWFKSEKALNEAK